MAVDAYNIKKYIKFGLLFLAVLIGVVTVWVSNSLVRKLETEERKKMELWARAIEIVSDPETDLNADLEFHSEVIKSNTTIPAILVDEKGNILRSINLDPVKGKSNAYLKEKIKEFASERNPIAIPIGDNMEHKAYYGNSTVLQQLSRFPYFILGVVAMFILVAYFAFNFSRRAEQNQVWVGLAKETAHQLGTPISSLMGWIEFIDDSATDLPANATGEMRKDISRLNIITERFSKIGSTPELQPVSMNEALRNTIDYMRRRVGKNVVFDVQIPESEMVCGLNYNLFGWVIENLIKNSIDAMDGLGILQFSMRKRNNKIVIDITDSGKGIPRNKFKTVFKPGYTTKKRGWGLGLSLAKRIIHNYHNGQIFVKDSVLGQGTTFRIILNEIVKQ